MNNKYIFWLTLPATLIIAPDSRCSDVHRELRQPKEHNLTGCQKKVWLVSLPSLPEFKRSEARARRFKRQWQQKRSHGVDPRPQRLSEKLVPNFLCVLTDSNPAVEQPQRLQYPGFHGSLLKKPTSKKGNQTLRTYFSSVKTKNCQFYLLKGHLLNSKKHRCTKNQRKKRGTQTHRRVTRHGCKDLQSRTEKKSNSLKTSKIEWKTNGKTWTNTAGAV